MLYFLDALLSIIFCKFYLLRFKSSFNLNDYFKSSVDRISGKNSSTSTPPDFSLELEISRKCQGAIKLACRILPFNVTCLPRSLSLLQMLKRRKIQADLNLGIKKQDVHFEGHAWVTLRGQVINDTQSNVSDYSSFTTGAVDKLSLSDFN